MQLHSKCICDMIKTHRTMFEDGNHTLFPKYIYTVEREGKIKKHLHTAASQKLYTLKTAMGLKPTTS